MHGALCAVCRRTAVKRSMDFQRAHTCIQYTHTGYSWKVRVLIGARRSTVH
jgi:hypothetical protein